MTRVPDRDSYADPSSKAAALRDKYQAHVAAILKLAGVVDSQTAAARVLKLEVGIAATHAPDSDAADVFKQNNPWKRADFGVQAPGIDWESYFRAAGLSDQSDFIVWQPTAVTGASENDRLQTSDISPNQPRPPKTIMRSRAAS